MDPRAPESRKRGPMKRLAWMPPVLVLSVLSVLSLSCVKKLELTKAQARELIESSPAWSAPLAPTILMEPGFVQTPETKREIFRMGDLTFKENGPFGMGGQTATAEFTWRWNASYMVGDKVLSSKARLFNSGEGWKVYDDFLKKQIWAAERGDVE